MPQRSPLGCAQRWRASAVIPAPGSTSLEPARRSGSARGLLTRVSMSYASLRRHLASSPWCIGCPPFSYREENRSAQGPCVGAPAQLLRSGRRCSLVTTPSPPYGAPTPWSFFPDASSSSARSLRRLRQLGPPPRRQKPASPRSLPWHSWLQACATSSRMSPPCREACSRVPCIGPDFRFRISAARSLIVSSPGACATRASAAAGAATSLAVSSTPPCAPATTGVSLPPVSPWLPSAAAACAVLGIFAAVAARSACVLLQGRSPHVPTHLTSPQRRGGRPPSAQPQYPPAALTTSIGACAPHLARDSDRLRGSIAPSKRLRCLRLPSFARESHNCCLEFLCCMWPSSFGPWKRERAHLSQGP